MDRPDFGGYVTRNDMKCTDGLTIRKDAFKHCDGMKVPLFWNHLHDDPENVLGHVVLQHRDDGVYGYAKLNESKSGKLDRILIEHGDITAMSIFANQLKKRSSDVIHGMIREVSLVPAGANPGAFIDEITIAHGDNADGEAIIHTGEAFELFHADVTAAEKDVEAEVEVEAEAETVDETVAETTVETAAENIDETISHASDGAKDDKEDDMSNEPEKKADGDKTVAEIIDSMTEVQQNVMYALIANALNETENKSENEDNKEETTMKQNAFDKETQQNETTLSHSDMKTIIDNAKRNGSLRDAFVQHGASDEALMHAVKDDNGKTIEYGMANLNYLFPDAHSVSNIPDFISRDMTWVNKVMNGAKHLPFSRVRSIHANITMEEARAKGYVKGKKKAEEVFALLKRVTTPTTIYKKQKLDRDDIIDITDFDVVAWLKGEMRMMLNEEIARAILIGDGRNPASDDKISEDHIRPIATDDPLWTIQAVVTPGASDEATAKNFMKACIRARKDYKGSGNPVMFTTEENLTNMLLIEDGIGHPMYKSESEIATACRVKKVVTSPVMEGVTLANGNEIMAVIVNLTDYNVGADKGGEINMFDDFDIDYNQQKYLIETRCSGALVKPYSAIVIEEEANPQ